MKQTMVIWCCTCQSDVNAYLRRLGKARVWQCPKCPDSRVMTHFRANTDKLKPLGTLGDDEMRKARNWIHNYLDPLYRHNLIRRQTLYDQMSIHFKREYHTAGLRSMEEARFAFHLAREFGMALLRDRFHKAKADNDESLLEKVKACCDELEKVNEKADRATRLKRQKLQKQTKRRKRCL
ncbi:zinc-finger-containing protein [Vibrio owensii]|uniref:zinc-finger-containing protein n=1 Tax=Vibrio owensii TaxID=696485 RepID=UPI0018F161DB|nr:zinc-finger-containing protein [Vibrio owensii]